MAAAAFAAKFLKDQPAPVVDTKKISDVQKVEDYVICFDASKRETHTPAQGLKQLCRKLRYKIQTNKDEITSERLQGVNLFVLGGPREKFSTAEFEAIRKYIQGGGSVLLLLGEGGENRFGTNVNYLTEEFGVMVNSDSVIRTVYYKYLHPKEVYITDGIVNRGISAAVGRIHKGIKDAARAGAKKKWEEVFVPKDGESAPPAQEFDKGGVNFVYPYGATLAVQKPAVPLLATGHIAYPLNRPIGAAYSNKNGKGKLMVLGSVLVIDDTYIDAEENMKLMDVMIRWLLGTDNITLDSQDADDPDVSEYHQIPDISALAERMRCCLQESEELPRDFTILFNDSLFKFDTNLIPEAVILYEKLGVKHEPLTLIPPQFETPLPALTPAVFPPALRELPPPALDLFDLDEQFASERIRMAHLTNKCTENDLEYYVRESGDILGVTNKLKPDKRTAKHILQFIFRQVVNFKKLNPGDQT
mmetsp:Transcript_44569/g.72554  ORF Transcript_44569/g.72554 Transcript_44569/m.72554 type:complete len:474 (-) Transcript_44569:306-1727(-)